MLLHWIHDTNPGPLSILSINLVAHDGPTKVVSMNPECKGVKWQNAISDITVGVPEL